MQGNSNQDNDGITRGTTALQLGTNGMDLRKPVDPAALADLVNARFLDERTVERRDGHTGQNLKDGGTFPAGGSAVITEPAGWIYGHGQGLFFYPGALSDHYPVHMRGGLTFRLGNTDVAWTGDRLLIPQAGGKPAIGSSTFWQRAENVAAGDAVDKTYPFGIPAFMPLENEVLAPAPVTGDWVEGCVTAGLRMFCYIIDNAVWVVTMDRTKNLIIDISNVTGISTSPVEPTLLLSGSTPVVVFRDSASLTLFIRFWTGVEWTSNNFGQAQSYSACATPGGVQLVWRNGSQLLVGRYAEGIAQAPFGNALTTSFTPSGPLAVSVAQDGRYGVAYVASASVGFDEYSSVDAGTGYSMSRTLGAKQGISVTSRAMTNTADQWEWIIHSADSNVVTVTSFSQYATSIGVGGYVGYTSTHRYNSVMLSRSFMVGDEVFCWLKSNNAQTGYLLAGAIHPVIAGYADREVAITPKTPGMSDAFDYWPARVVIDPADSGNRSLSWVRKFNTGISSRTGNTIAGDMNFTPHPCAATYGKSTYISGSAVKNFDGVDLDDAGYQDFPIISNSAPSTSTGALTLLGTYQYIARIVRYNTAGERFESAAETFVAPVLTGSDNTITLTINTVPSISGPASNPDYSDATIEIYRTENLGSTFYLEGTVTNQLDVATVSFVSIMSDATLISQLADPHATGVGNVQEIESFGPIGCAILVTVGDRMWGAGGQVPPGELQFSKLKDVGFGAGFDDLAGYIQVDSEGGEITSLIGQNGALVAFEHNRGYVYSNTGPDNDGNGAFGTPEVVLAAGALNHFGTGLCQAGVLYWGIEGPLLLDQSFTVQNISSPLRPLTKTLLPTGIRIDTDRMEVVWYCSGGQAVLWNYMGGTSRWGRWTVPEIASVSDSVLITTDGRILTEDATAAGDDGVPYAFSFRTGDIRPEALREGFAMIHRVGISGEYEGPHQLRMRVFFDGSPLWSEESIWQPTDETWLVSCDDYAALTPTAIDALENVDRSGAYSTNKRLRRETCRFISIEVSDVSSLYQTFIPYELAFEMGAKPGLGRVASSTFTGQDR